MKVEGGEHEGGGRGACMHAHTHISTPDCTLSNIKTLLIVPSYLIMTGWRASKELCSIRELS